MTTTPARERARTAGAFDIRLIIAMLFALFGLVITAVGLVGTDAEDIAKAAGLNINLYSGIAMLAFAAAFTVWAKLRPITVPDEVPESE
jgi:hypothetical protein